MVHRYNLPGFHMHTHSATPKSLQLGGWEALYNSRLNWNNCEWLIGTWNILHSRQRGQISGTAQDPSSLQVRFHSPSSLSTSKYRSGELQTYETVSPNSTGSAFQVEIKFDSAGACFDFYQSQLTKFCFTSGGLIHWTHIHSSSVSCRVQVLFQLQCSQREV